MSFDLSDLDLADMGSWPKVVKALCCTVVAAVLLASGYVVAIVDKRAELALAEGRESDLRHEFEGKRRKAADLAPQRTVHDAVQASFAEMVRRLPVSTEVPGLIEDITRAAVDNRLAIERIDLADERQVDFYRELPIDIGVSGDYHDLGAFVSVIAALPRLVTLHDFDLAPRDGPRDLALAIEARTYRHASDAASTTLDSPAQDRPAGDALPSTLSTGR